MEKGNWQKVVGAIGMCSEVTVELLDEGEKLLKGVSLI